MVDCVPALGHMNEKTNRTISIAALACSLVALSLTSYQFLGDTRKTAVTDRVDQLELEMFDRGVGLIQDRVEYSRPAYPLPASVSRELESADRLDRDVDEMRWTMTVRGFMPATEEQIERSEAIIFNENHCADSKMLALRVLRRGDRLSDEIVREIINEFHETDDHRMQEDILELLDGLTTPELAPFLLRTSAESPNNRVRRQALDAMSGFLPDPKLENWLTHVRKNDSSKDVRDEAERLIRTFSQESVR